MNKMMKKAMAAAMALTIVGGGLPALTGGADIFKPAIVANAIDGLAPEVGKIYNWGQRIQLGELYLKDDLFYVDNNELILNYMTIEEPKYLDDKDMWSVGYAEGAALCALKSDADRHYEIPIGVRIVSGTGTYNDPFTMELVYSGDAVTPEEVTVGKKWYVGDTINTDAYFIGERVQVYGESNDPTSFSPGGNSCEFHLINKKLASAYKLHAHIDDEDRLVFLDTVSTKYTNLGMDGDGYPTGLAFEITSEDIIGIEVTGGSGTKADPFTLSLILAKQPELVSNTMTLGGSISLNFYFDLSEIPADKKADTYVEFEVNGKKQTANFDANKMNSKKTAYGFTCMLTSVSMADNVKATVHYFDENGDEKTFVTNSNGQAYLQKFDDSDGEKTYDLVKAVNDYGYYLQKYLCTAAATPWTYGVDHVSMDKCFTDTTTYLNNLNTYRSELSTYAKQINKNADINKFNYSLSLEADTTLIVRVKPEASYTGSLDITVTDSANNPVAFTASKMADGRTQVNIPNISAHKLGDTYTVSVKTTNGTSTFKASALSYVYEGISDFGSAEEFNAMCSIYEYYKKTIAFRTK